MRRKNENGRSETDRSCNNPTDIDVVPETLELMKRWGADAIRDCDEPITRKD